MRLTEHHYAASVLTHPNHLASHCAECTRMDVFSYTKVLVRSLDETEREITEAHYTCIGEWCINSASIIFSQKEIGFFKQTVSPH